MPAQLASCLKTKQRQKMIEYSIEEKAPKMYRRLKASGGLKAFVEETDRNMLVSFEDVLVRANQRIPDGTLLENIQNRTEALRVTWEEAMATWLEFSDGDEGQTT